MSKISLKPNSAGTANFEIAAPATNTDRTFTLPDEDGTLATAENIPAGYTDSDALDLFNVTGSAPVYACRAWVNFDGTGTVAIRGSGNVSSVTDAAVGRYNVNLATAMPDANASVVAFAFKESFPGGQYRRIATGFNTILASTFGIHTGTAQIDDTIDAPVITAAVFR